MTTLYKTLVGIVLISIVSMFSFPASSQTNPDSPLECPEGYKCLTEEESSKVSKALRHHNCMIDSAKEGDFSLTLKPYTITITDEGQVFSKDLIEGTIVACQYKLELQSKVKLKVNRQEKDEDLWGFRPRVRLGFAWLPLYIQPDNWKAMFDPVLMFEPFYVDIFHLQAHVGLKTFGLDAGVDITRNLDAFAGVGFGWKNPKKVTPILGFSLSFN